jgi:hypothetical protein
VKVHAIEIASTVVFVVFIVVESVKQSSNLSESFLGTVSNAAACGVFALPGLPF